MPNGTYGGVRGRKTKVGRKLLRFPPTRLPKGCLQFLSSSVLSLFLPLPHHYPRHAAYDADGGAGEDLAKGVALQEHAAAHDGS